MDSVTAVAFLNTDVAASFAAIAWLVVAWIAREAAEVRRPAHRRGGRPGHHHAGRRLRLAAAPPSSSASSPASSATSRWRSRTACDWDDALDVWGVHGVGGFLGIVLLGVFATTAFNPHGADGLLAGNPAFFVKQLAAVAVSSVWAFVFTYGMLWLIDRVTPVRVTRGRGGDRPRLVASTTRMRTWAANSSGDLPLRARPRTGRARRGR